VSPYGKASQRSVLGLSACNALAPNIECARLQLPAHKINNPRLIEPIFGLNDLERGSVLPGHFDHPANVITGKSICNVAQNYSRYVYSVYFFNYTRRYRDEFSMHGIIFKSPALHQQQAKLKKNQYRKALESCAWFGRRWHLR
jgi:hypothetical protein